MSKKKTHEEYVEEVKNINSNIEVIGRYNGANTKILHKCLLHNIEWEVTPSRILHGVGCEECRKYKFRQTRCKTHQQYSQELKLINPDIEVVGHYIDSKTPIELYCKKHNISWSANPDNVLRGHGCIECGKEKISNKLLKNHSQYVKELEIVNKNIIPIENYINASTPILHKCLIDGYEWHINPSNALNGYGCLKCSNRIKRTHNNYISDLYKINPNIEVIGTFVNMRTKILHKCLLHNIEWEVVPYSILNGQGCIECGKEKIKKSLGKTHEEYIEELSMINTNIIAIDRYINSSTAILHKCLKDNYEWYAYPSNILRGFGCPKCNQSKGEKSIHQWLNNHNIIYISQKTFKDCRDIKPLPFDFYLSDYNMAIEYDGEQHYRPVEYFGGQKSFERTQRHDKIKDEYCKNNNIKLLRIPYFKDIEEELNNFLFI